MPRKPTKTLEEAIAKLTAEQVAENDRLKRQRIQRIEKRMARAVNGNAFKGTTPHEIYVSPKAYQAQINAYFSLCEEKGEPQTLPGLALAVGVRTKTLMEYDAPPEFKDYKRLTEYATQRIEAYMAKGLFSNTGSTKGREFLAQNTLGYANKSDVNAKQALDISERQRVQSLTDDELTDRAAFYAARILKLVPKTDEDESREA